MNTYFKILESGEKHETDCKTAEQLVNCYIDFVNSCENIVLLDDDFWIDEEIIVDDDNRLCTKIRFYLIPYDKNNYDFEPEENILYWYNQKRNIKYSIHTTDDNRNSSYFYKQDSIYTDLENKFSIIFEILEKEYADYEILDEFKSLNSYLKTCPCYYIKHRDDYNNDWFYEDIRIENL